MYTLTLQDLRRNGSKAIKDDVVSYLLVNSKVKSVIVPAKHYEMMIEMLEDAEDIRLAKERLGEQTIPLEYVIKKIDKKHGLQGTVD